ncbi:retrovirus-related Pol polyprotein from transposon 412 [Trichonephila clavipes]|uniref:Retrovirus-related Pol polyprotein from transposon 412 n=1 Tax=Trichonephila clavipes TaxID=2585209 RepID=A0A8X6T427_TRICX|nr:retrovirus-related Pol polyprotein from transposon 412 [Trichonephila clavipes]
MVVDTGANVSIIRKDLAQNSQVGIIWTPPSVSLQTVTGDKIQVHGKANITLMFGNIDYRHTAYIADITDPCILGLDFLKNNNFKLTRIIVQSWECGKKDSSLLPATVKVCIIGLKEEGWAKRRIARHMGQNDEAIGGCSQK